MSEAYRLEALLELAAVYPETLSGPEVARRRGIPAPFLGRLLAAAARDGIVATSRGPRGGVRLARPPADIRLGSVLAEAAPAGTRNPALDWLADRLGAARRAVLDRTSLADLLAVERERRADTDWQI